MRVLLVRHGETVDNVSGLYAGVRDSPLTAHGVLQARRLGAYLAARSPVIGPVTHVFSSDLQRAANTAQAVLEAQASRESSAAIPGRAPVRLVKLPELRERDFGSAEGKRFGTPHADAETHEKMRLRADRFVRAHLGPLLQNSVASDGLVVVVSHGILLNSLLKVLLTRFAPSELARLAPGPGSGRSDYLASWGNTGYLEMVVRQPFPSGAAAGPESRDRRERVSLAVVQVNALHHLEGLKKTRGGIGSARFDSRQRTMDSFLAPRKRKAEET
ncbi:phosphoglycerate mutase [Echria macrotheca]|uniref:Phosphoglycerate mutase n=1 Tax=Echria macrotheca TaxID=438768 RepID=A0AAJ0BC76_9PEZI|nr:phosphoglycerate mutase [Echria macrotheca]